jgi:type IV pilus biogenesis protein CpaD/CtpE
MPRTLFATVMPATLALLLGGCASKPNIDYDPSFDFAVVRHYRISDPVTSDTGDPRIDNPLLFQRIHAAISAELDNRGYRAADDSADITVHYTLGKREGVEARNSGVSIGVGTYRRGSGAAIGYNYPAYDITSYEEGVLTIDMLDSPDKRLVWRGSSARRLSETGITPEAITKAVNEVVAEILEQFPPGRSRQ